MWKLSARWVPRWLTVNQNSARMNIRKNAWSCFSASRFITRWNYYTEGTKKPSKQYGYGIIFINYFEKGKITEYYAILMDCFNNQMKRKRPHLARKKVLFMSCAINCFRINRILPFWLLLTSSRFRKWKQSIYYWAPKKMCFQTTLVYRNSSAIPGITKLSQMWLLLTFV